MNSLITSRNPESNKAGLNLAMSLLRNSWQVLPMDITSIESTQKIIFAVLLSNLAKEIEILSVNVKHRPPENRTDSKFAKGDIATINQKLEIMQGKIDRLDLKIENNREWYLQGTNKKQTGPDRAGQFNLDFLDFKGAVSD